MTAFVPMIFMSLPNGNVQVRTYPQMLIGADQCQTLREAALHQLEASGVDPTKVRVECVDSGLYPGVES